MKKLFTNYFYIFITLLSVSFVGAQCNISTFTVAQVSGVCVQDGKINVTIPGATSCTGGSAVIASLYPAGSTSALDFVNLTATGTGTFFNLPPGDYEVQLQQGATTSARKPVTVTTSYVRINISATSKNTTCAPSNALYSENGSVTGSFTGGNGPFKVELLKDGAVVQTIPSTTTTTYEYLNLGVGNYQVRITDLSSDCIASETRSVTVAETVYSQIVPTYGDLSLVTMPSSTDCTKIELMAMFWDTGNASNTGYVAHLDDCYIKVNGVTYPATGIYPNNKLILFDGVLEEGDVIEEIYITDGCTEWTGTNYTVHYTPDEYMYIRDKIIKNPDCTDGVSFETRGYTTDDGFLRSFTLGLENMVQVYQEQPADSNNWVLVHTATDRPEYAFNSTAYSPTFDDANTRYKFVFSDNCHSFEKIRDPRTSTYFNELNYLNLVERQGIYEGTSSIYLNGWNSGIWASSNSDRVSYPITVSVMPTDGSTSATINSANPFNLSGEHTITYPTTTVFDKDISAYGPLFNGVGLGDYPPGEYEVTTVDACGESFVRTITLSNPAEYTKTDVIVDYGCASSNIVFDIEGNNIVDYGFVSLRANNNGEPGSVIRNSNENPDHTLSGQFSDVPPGDYFVYFDRILYNIFNFNRIADAPVYSAIKDDKSVLSTYYAPITVRPYTPLSFASFNILCDPNDPNTAVLSLEVEGTPVDYITYSIWNAADNPDTATPIMTYNTTDLTEMSHIFTGLSTGSYKVRVMHDCGFTEQDITIQEGPAELPAPISIPSNTVCDSDPEVSLHVALPESLFDINWYDGNNQLIGTGSDVDYTVPQSETITVKYSLTQALGCTNTTEFVDTIDITLTPEYALAATGPGLPTQTGISVLGRSDRRLASDWPGSRESANLVLEGKTLGLVINRIATTAELANIANPVEGMIVFDMEADCLKLYTTQDDGTSFDWYCVSTQTCSNQH